MANINAPFGLRQQTSAVGAPSNFQMIPKNIAYNDTTKIFTGDPIKVLDTGYIAQWAAADGIAKLAGIFDGVEYLSTAQGKMTSSNFWPGADVASTAQSTIVAKIIPVTPGSVFLVQSDGTGVAFTDIGLNAEITIGTGNVQTGQSGAYLSGVANTATLPFRIIGLYGGLPGAGGALGIQPGTNGPYSGSATGAYNWVLVQPNLSGTGSLGT